MTRPRRIDLPGGRYHLISRGVNREQIFFGDEDRVEFGRLLNEIYERFGVRMLAYCLMNNHFHLIAQLPRGGLSNAMQHLCGTFARHVNERVGRTGHLFGARFFSALLDTDRYLLTAIRYVERNALDLPGVERPSDHRWSSHRANAGFKPGPEWLDTPTVRSYFGDSARYQRFIDSEVSTTEPEVIDPALLSYLVDVAIAMYRPDDLPPQSLDRIIKLLLLEELNERNAQLIARELGFSSDQAQRDALGRARKRANEEAAIGTIVSAARQLAFDAHGDPIQRFGSGTNLWIA